uniref:GNAT family N-acetyltransferase n=1 Tax=Streptomyces lonarensis TaxID=700599 RepID=UPI0028A9937D|nr:GNAT family N-acetyltransferase [Streptomyces lonarensis]
MGVRMEVRVGPEDVGRRVSVRSLTGDASPGTRFTDTLGVLTHWSAERVVVTRRDGTAVTLTTSDVVAAKVVPAAPARRGGAPSAGIAEVTRVAARGWPPLVTREQDGWLLRAAEGWTNRANSAVPATDDAAGEERLDLDAVRRWYAERGLPALLHVPTGGGAGGRELLAERLAGLGWTAEKPAVVRVAPLAPLADRAPDPRVSVGRELTGRWLRGYRNADRDPAAARRLLPAGPSVLFATVARDDDSGGCDGDGLPAAVGRCVVDGRWAGFASIEVAPDRRRRGLARAVMAELARAALAEGASAAYLQVERDNAPAHTLYERLGFTVHHHYHYRRAPLP